MDEKRSPADICLKRAEEWVTFTARDTIEIDEGVMQIKVTVEHRAWVCPFCSESTEYLVVNDCIVKGTGRSTMFANGRAADYCDNWKCQRERDRFLGILKEKPC